MIVGKTTGQCVSILQGYMGLLQLPEAKVGPLAQTVVIHGFCSGGPYFSSWSHPRQLSSQKWEIILEFTID